jgi:protein-glutamine gamma-glutamyltransferase
LTWTVRWRLQLTDWHDLLTYRWEYLVLAFDPERQRELFARFGLDPTDWRSVLIALVVSMGAIGATAGLLAWLRRPRSTRDTAQRALDRLSRRLARIGLARRPHETAEGYAARIRERRPDLDPILQDFTNAYVHLRYAALAPSEATRFQQQLNHSLRTARIRI